MRTSLFRSIRFKLIGLFLAFSLLTLFISGGVFAYKDLENYQKDLKQNLVILADTVGTNSQSSIQFNDPGAGRRFLSSLRSDSQIVSAILYDADDELFARYTVEARWKDTKPASLTPGEYVFDEHIEIVRRIQFERKPIGKIVVFASLDRFKERKESFMVTAGLVFFLTLAISLILSVVFQNLVSKPILSLAETASQISKSSDYSLKVEHDSSDEIGTLASDFNIMISRIKAREEEIQRSKEELRILSQRLQSAREEEKQRIAREIHDDLGQAMTRLGIEVACLKDELTTDDPAVQGSLQSIKEIIETTIDTVQKIATELRPQILDIMGLWEAIEWQTREYKKRGPVEFELVNDVADVEVDSDRAITLFRIYQETVTNALRHSKASKITIRIFDRDAAFVLEVQDNGVGMSPGEKEVSFGLIGIRERALLFNGHVEIESQPSQGTLIRVHIPYKNPPRQ